MAFEVGVQALVPDLAGADRAHLPHVVMLAPLLVKNVVVLGVFVRVVGLPGDFIVENTINVNLKGICRERLVHFMTAV